MKIDVLTLFPEMFKGVFEQSIIGRAQKNKSIQIKIHNLRDWAKDKHRTVDDSPYGGGAGMVLRIDVLDKAIAELRSSRSKRSNRSKRSEQAKRCNERSDGTTTTILLTPQGKQFNQKKAKTLSSYSNLLLICGHYEGFDERVRKLVDEEISIGPYVLTGGEIPAMVLVDAITRLIPGVLGKAESASEDSFSMGKLIENFTPSVVEGWKLKIENCNLLEYPQYTRPESYQPISKKFTRPLKVPKILLSGNHQKIAQWRLEQAIKKTCLGDSGRQV